MSDEIHTLDPASSRARFDQSFPNPGKPAHATTGMVLQRMKRVVDTSEVLGTVEMPGEVF